MPNALEPLEPRRHLSAGDLDPSFGTGGTVTLRNGTVPTNGTPDTTATLLTLDHAGRTLVVSSSYTTGQHDDYSRPAAYALTRLTADGRPDARFALPSGGAIPLTPDEVPRKILIDSQDRIYVISEVYVRRYTASGKIDRSYGARGAAETDNYFGQTVDATLTADDVLWLLGTTTDDEGPDGAYSYVTRLAADGVHYRDVEGSFAANDPSTPGNAYDYDTGPGLLRTLPDGSVLAAFDTYNNVYPDNGDPIVRENGVTAFKFRPNGRVDRTYGSGGRAAYRWIGPVTNDVGDASSAYLAGLFDDGTVLVRDEPAHAAARHVTLTTAGHQGANVAFGSAVLQNANPGEYTFHRQPDGRRLVFDSNQYTVRRFNANGTHDTTFNHGLALTDVTAIAFGPNNTLLTTDSGRSDTDSSFVVRRIKL